MSKRSEFIAWCAEHFSGHLNVAQQIYCASAAGTLPRDLDEYYVGIDSVLAETRIHNAIARAIGQE